MSIVFGVTKKYMTKENKLKIGSQIQPAGRIICTAENSHGEIIETDDEYGFVQIELKVWVKREAIEKREI